MRKLKAIMWLLACVLLLGSPSYVKAEDTNTEAVSTESGNTESVNTEAVSTETGSIDIGNTETASTETVSTQDTETTTDYTQAESYLTLSFQNILSSGDLSYASDIDVTDDTTNNGIMITGSSSGLSDQKISFKKTFHFDGNRVGRIALDALAAKGEDLTISFYLDDSEQSFADISILKQGRSDDWTKQYCLHTDILDQNVIGDHTISFKITAEDSDTVTLLLRSIEFVESDLPTVYMDLDETLGTVNAMMSSEDHSKECYGDMTIEIPAGYTYEFGDDAGQVTTSDTKTTYELDYIKGRGNSTWEGSDGKNPYKIKLENKQSLLGMGANKHWALIANRFDNTKIRNRMTYQLARDMGAEYSPALVPVDVIVNGIYFGSYYLSETVRLDKTRVNIDDLEKNDETKASTDPDIISGGYLLQYDSWGVNDDYLKFATDKGLKLAIMSPSFDGYTNDTQYNYIVNYVQHAEDTIYSKGFKDSDGVSYTDYVDIDSMINYYLVQEISMNGDGFASGSNYLYKKRDGKLYWGPLWDFDLAWEADLSDETGGSGFSYNEYIWYDQLMHDTVFTDRLLEKWEEFKSALLDYSKDGGLIDQYYEQLLVSERYDVEKWGYYEYENPDENTYYDEKEHLKDVIKARVAWVDANIETLPQATYTVTFNVDGKTVYTTTTYGDMTDVEFPDAPEKKGYYFGGWMVCDEDGEEEGYYLTSDSCVIEDTIVKASYIATGSLPEKLYLSDTKINIDMDADNLYGYELSASVYPEGCYNLINYTASNPDVASVDSDGEICLGDDLGDSTITVTCGNLKKTCKIHVYCGDSGYEGEDIDADSESFEKADITFTTNNINLKKGQWKQITLHCDPTDHAYERLQWTSTNSSVAAVDDCGVVLAKKNGTAIIYMVDSEGNVNTCTVTVGTETVKKGYIYTYKGLRYKVTSKAKKGGTVTVLGPTGKKIRSVNIRNTVKIKGETYKVTAIANKAFYKCKNLKKIYLGKNLKSIGSKAFSGIKSKARIRVPVARKKAYKKLLSSKTGFKKKTMKVYYWKG